MAVGWGGGRFFCASVGGNFVGSIVDWFPALGPRYHQAPSGYRHHGKVDDSSLSPRSRAQ